MNKFRDIEKEGIVILNRAACAHQWISVKDRLPENRKLVLAIDEFGEMAVCEAKIDYQYIFMLYNTSHQIKNVTHWMPLPEPPKENE